VGPPMDVVPERCRGDGVTASGSLQRWWGWLTWWCRRCSRVPRRGGRRDSDGGSCWRPLRVGRQPLRPGGPYVSGRYELVRRAKLEGGVTLSKRNGLVVSVPLGRLR